MNEEDSIQPESSNEDEQFIKELKAMPSSFAPERGIDLCGFATEELAQKVGNEVYCLLHQFGKLLRLKLLHRVIVAYDYAGALTELDRGVKTGRELSPTNDDIAIG